MNQAYPAKGTTGWQNTIFQMMVWLNLSVEVLPKKWN